jgi:hypothetical protein
MGSVCLSTLTVLLLAALYVYVSKYLSPSVNPCNNLSTISHCFSVYDSANDLLVLVLIYLGIFFSTFY